MPRAKIKTTKVKVTSGSEPAQPRITIEQAIKVLRDAGLFNHNKYERRYELFLNEDWTTREVGFK